jgi:hypothetical protein
MRKRVDRTTRILFIILGFALSHILYANHQEKTVNQRKIDKEREKKALESRKKYEQAVKRHYDIQSKETKKMMKQAKKDQKKNIPRK